MNITDKYDEASKLIDRGKYDDAEVLLEEILNVEPYYCNALNKKGVIFANKNNFSYAEEMFQKCMDIDKEFVPAIVNMGNIYKQNNQNDKAIQMYEKAIAIDETYSLAYHNLACVYKSMKNYSKYYANIKKYRRNFRHQITNNKKEYFRNVDKNKKYISTGIFAVIIVILIIFVTRK